MSKKIDFKKIYEVYPLVDVLQKYGCEVYPVGSGHGVTECPFCGGHDCFRTFEDDTKWSCFQCPDGKMKQDVVNFISFMEKKPLKKVLAELLSDNDFSLDAVDFNVQEAKTLALKYWQKNLINQYEDKKFSVLYNGKIIKESLKFYVENVRGVLGLDFLLNNGVGFVSGSVVDYLKECGIKDKVIAASGLIDVENNSDYYPSGTFIFANYVGNFISSFSTDKSPERNRKPKKTKKQYILNSDILYNAGSITNRTATIFITEGIWDLLAVGSYLPNINKYAAVVATDGRISDRQMDYLEELKLPIVELFDADQAGMSFRNRMIARPNMPELFDIPPTAFGDKKDVGEYIASHEDREQALRELLSKAEEPKVYDIPQNNNKKKTITKTKKEDQGVDDYIDIDLEYSVVAEALKKDNLSSIGDVVSVISSSQLKNFLTEIVNQVKSSADIDPLVACKTLGYDDALVDDLTNSEEVSLKVGLKRLRYLKRCRTALSYTIEIPNIVREAEDLDDLDKQLKTFLSNFTSNLFSSDYKGEFSGDETYDVLLQMSETQGEKINFYFDNLDPLITVGLRPKTCTVLAGRPGAGKSMLKVNVIRNQCDNGIGVLSYVPENGIWLEQNRLDSLMLGVSFDDIVLAKEGDLLYEKMKNNWRYIQKNWAYFVSEEEVSVGKISTDLIAQKRKFPHIKNWVVYVDMLDYLSELDTDNSRWRKIGSVLRNLKSISGTNELDFAPVVIVHINRDKGKNLKTSKSKKPTMHDLRGSGDIEGVADLVLIVHRESVYDEELDDDIMEVDIAKQRGGSTNITVFYDYQGDMSRVEPLDDVGAGGVSSVSDNDFEIPTI